MRKREQVDLAKCKMHLVDVSILARPSTGKERSLLWELYRRAWDYVLMIQSTHAAPGWMKIWMTTKDQLKVKSRMLCFATH